MNYYCKFFEECKKKSYLSQINYKNQKIIKNSNLSYYNIVVLIIVVIINQSWLILTMVKQNICLLKYLVIM